MSLRVTGLNHKRAAVELRERLAVPPAALAAELAAAQSELGAGEAVVLSTCNRVELYQVGGGDAAAFLARRRGIPEAELRPLVYEFEGLEAARHLFRVAAGFDSMVPGETQILGQARDAYHAARDLGCTGRVTNKLFQGAFSVAKRIHTETGLAERSVSVPSVATRLAGKVFTDLRTKTALILGAGETGRLTLQAFRDQGVERFLVVNRTIEKAREMSGEAYGLDQLGAVLARADIVIACITHDGYAIAPEQVHAALKARRQEPMFLIDIAVPRNIHPEVNRLDNVYLFDIDDLQVIVAQNLKEREREIDAVLPIVDRAAQSVMKELEAFDVTRVLTQLRDACRRIGDEESAKTFSKLAALDPAAREEVAYLVQRVVNRILHAPTTALKSEAQNGEAYALAELAVKLFGLGEKKEKEG